MKLEILICEKVGKFSEYFSPEMNKVAYESLLDFIIKQRYVNNNKLIWHPLNKQYFE